MRCFRTPRRARPAFVPWATVRPIRKRRSPALKEWASAKAGVHVSKRNDRRSSVMLMVQIAIMMFMAVTATAVVLTRDPASQSVSLSFFGILLALMFFIFQARDVALSQ